MAAWWGECESCKVREHSEKLMDVPTRMRRFVYIFTGKSLINLITLRDVISATIHTCGRTEIRDHEGTCEQFMLYARGALCGRAYPNLSYVTQTHARTIYTHTDTRLHYTPEFAYLYDKIFLYSVPVERS